MKRTIGRLSISDGGVGSRGDTSSRRHGGQVSAFAAVHTSLLQWLITTHRVSACQALGDRRR